MKNALLENINLTVNFFFFSCFFFLVMFIFEITLWESKRERKAAKTLAIITGAFVVCWLPFFVIALLMPVCAECHFDDNMVAFFLWLGYFNSTLNPILYTIFSPEFRNAFTKLLRLNRPSAGLQRPVNRQQQQLQQLQPGRAGGNNNKLNELADQQSICSGWHVQYDRWITGNAQVTRHHFLMYIPFLNSSMWLLSLSLDPFQPTACITQAINSLFLLCLFRFGICHSTPPS